MQRHPTSAAALAAPAGPAAVHGSKTPAAIGLAFAIFFWGTQLPIAQSVLQSIDQYYFALSRYGGGLWLFVLTLYAREGRGAFSLDGRGAAVVWFGFCGFTGFGLLIFWALLFTVPAHVSIIMASQPLMTALWMWGAQRRRPPRATMVCIAAALAGLFLIITRGDPKMVFAGGSIAGDAMALGAAACWVAYTMGQSRFADWSPFRYATLANIAGTIGLFAVILPLTWMGIAHVPSRAALADNGLALAYIAIFPLYAAIMLSAVAVKRLGALNTLLAGNGIPVVVFAIEAVRGRLPTAVEWMGAGLVIAALAANNLLSRREKT